MERIILWHLETDLDIYSKLSKKQYGFRRGCSTIAAVHKLVRKLEFAILNQGMALGTFLDIEGAFDNVSFDAIERALNLKCKSRGVNRWIMSMIRNRRILVGLQDEKRVILIRKGCPQGGILSPFLWNLVVNELLEYTWDKMPSDLQGFADDMSLVSIVTAPKRPNGKPGYDADTLREVTQKSLNSINAWCKRSGLKLSHLKSHCVMFTNRRNWSFDRPLKVDGAEIDVLGSTKFLGITLDSKLSWNEHIDNLCKKTKGILMQCRRVVGPTWGFKPATMRWVYDVMVKPILSYGATIWVNGTKTKHNQQLLSGVQRLANVIITGALPTTPGSALDVINGSPPLHLWLAEEAAKGALRLKNLGHWLPPPAGRANMRLTSHITTIENTLRSIPECKLERDETTPKLCIDQQFEIEIPTRESYHEKDYTEFGATCFTDGSKTSEGVGSGVVINATIGGETINHEESYHLNEHCTVFQAEVHAVGQAATYLLEKEVKGQSILINCDSQSAIRAINSTIIRNHTILETSRKLNALGKSNTVLLRWIPAHQGHEGNERADTLAKNGANMSDNPTMVKLPIPRGVCYAALRRKTIAEWRRNFKISPPKVFSTMWRDRFSKELPKLGKRDLRTATQILTGHACLNYHLSKINRDIAPTCSLCQEENETVEHVLAKCPKLWELRVEFFDSHFTTVRDIVDRHTLSHIVNFLHRTGQLKTLEAK
jgi:ribonuclease HI